MISKGPCLPLAENTGHFLEQWSTGCIYPIFKNKGSRENVQNYRPITILSCLGKLFTGILNSS